MYKDMEWPSEQQVLRVTSKSARLESVGCQVPDDEGLVCQAEEFGLDPGREGQPKELLVEGRRQTY
jgi:hypothetical protein